MAQPYVGEIRMFAGTFAPQGWAFCDGQLLPISENDALFSLIGTTYGGDGQNTFALPDLRGRVPVHQSGTQQMGSAGGAETVTLNTGQLPAHSHGLMASTAVATLTDPGGNVSAQSGTFDGFQTSAPTTAMGSSSIYPVGDTHAHDNVQPFLCIHFIISLFGIYPPRT